MKIWNTIFIASVFILSTNTKAALVERLGGQAYYDTEANLTWLADANLIETSGYDDALYGINTNGRLNWADANNWAENLNIDGVIGWRLANSDNCTEYSCTNSEMGNLYYNVLGGQAATHLGLTHNTNYNLFRNIQFDSYWSSTVDANNDRGAWYFSMDNGYQTLTDNTLNIFAWAVHDGDVSVVPIPAAVWLFSTGLIVLTGLARHNKT